MTAMGNDLGPDGSTARSRFLRQTATVRRVAVSWPLTASTWHGPAEEQKTVGRKNQGFSQGFCTWHVPEVDL